MKRAIFDILFTLIKLDFHCIFVYTAERCIIFPLTARITKLLCESSINMYLMTIDSKKVAKCCWNENIPEFVIWRFCMEN